MPEAPKGKVFGIGFHKTGTKSLARALGILGYAVTGPNGVNDPDIGGNALDMALRLARRFDAFQDNPWPLLYREMDAAFPRSKFILTVRPTQEWIASIVSNFGDNETPMRRWIYGHGSPLGNEQAYVSRYDDHNAAVRSDFAAREDDLLIMDFFNGDNWEVLCDFLGKTVPDAPFPHLNRSAMPEGKP